MDTKSNGLDELELELATHACMNGNACIYISCGSCDRFSDDQSGDNEFYCHSHALSIARLSYSCMECNDLHFAGI